MGFKGEVAAGNGDFNTKTNTNDSIDDSIVTPQNGNGKGSGDFDIPKLVDESRDVPKPEPTPAKVERPHFENRTDLGNAKRLATKHGAKIRYVHLWNRWLIWDGKRWLPDETGEIHRLARDTVKAIYAEASMVDDDFERKELGKWARQSENKTKLDAMVSLAQSEHGVPVAIADLDGDQWLLNVENGILDLRTGKLHPHQGDKLITKIAPVTYDEKATCPRWLATLDRIFAGDWDLIEFLQRAVGMSLTGDTSEQVLFFCYGSGANGKSTFLNVLTHMLGDYALKTPTDTFLLKKNEGVSNDVARLRGARLVLAAEMPENRRLNESLVKDITGGDVISARFMRQEFFEFKPVCKPWLYGNHKPNIKGTDHGIWRRVKLVPFNVTIPESEQNPHLTSELIQAELSGILAWAVGGCLKWQQNGLTIPDAVSIATDNYRAEQDVLRQFENDCLIITPSAKVQTKELYERYVAWCENNGERQETKQRLSTMLEERGFTQIRGTNNKPFWQGVALVAE